MRVLTRAFLIFAVFIATVQLAWAQAEERTIYAGVVDKNDAPVAGMRAAEFIVREDTLAREVLRAGAATDPLQVALLIDTSAAIEDHILDIRTALRGFFKQMAGKHDVAVIGFGERPTVLVEYTQDAARLEKSIGLIFPRAGSGTYLLDAIVESSEGLRRREAKRPHIVVFAARGPEFSERYHQTVLDALREARATLHVLRLNKPGVSPRDREGQELELAVANGTRMSGGRREDLLTSMALAERLQSLAVELDSQYEVTYARPRTLIPPKSIEVSVKRPELTVRASRWPQ
jgi:Ca-activated chloride channel family protein